MKANIQKIDKKNEVSNTKPQFPSFFGKARLEESFNAFCRLHQTFDATDRLPLCVFHSSVLVAFRECHQRHSDREQLFSAYHSEYHPNARNNHQTAFYDPFQEAAENSLVANSSSSIQNKFRIELQWIHLLSRNQIHAFFVNKKEAIEKILRAFYHLLKNTINNNNNANKLKD